MTLNIQLLIFSCILDLVLCSKDLPFTACTKNHNTVETQDRILTSKFHVSYMKYHTNVCIAFWL